jgi:HD superfamily phosphohydrolase
MHLMSAAVSTLQSKGVNISEKEAESVHAAILMHDMGHGPFSHALESSLIPDVRHEKISLFFMESLNNQFNGKFSQAIEIFTGKYPKKFLCQLVSSQLDMDRLDYLKRDSFYTGVCEGVISSDRIINMLQVQNDKLVVEVKGIYSIENFLVSRRLMYWQVYLHKTAIVAENMLEKILKRARQLIYEGNDLNICKQLDFFLRNKITCSDFKQNKEILNFFATLDDHDIISALKSWTYHEDKILSTLSKSLLNRKLLSIELNKEPVKLNKINSLKEKVMKKCNYTEEETEYFVFTGTISNNAYNIEDDKINILLHDKSVKDISDASDMFNLAVLSKTVEKNFVCYPKIR